MSQITDVDLALGILDHQLVDGDGNNCGKVDDVEITGLDGNSPEVVEILVGGNAWRSRGRPRPPRSPPFRDAVHVPWAEVDAVSSVVTLKRSSLRTALEPR